jgi:hypothetical protein
MIWKLMDRWYFVAGIMSITSCIDRMILSHQRAELTGPYKGCVCTPKEQK